MRALAALALRLYRYPALDPVSFRRAVEAAAAGAAIKIVERPQR